VLTVAVSRIDLGAANVPIALAIAIVKAILIVLFFMHVRYGSPLLRLFAAGGFFWLLILLGFIMADVRARFVGW
jgi:cytochrome c oxidase subunit 4